MKLTEAVVPLMEGDVNGYFARADNMTEKPARGPESCSNGVSPVSGAG